MVSPVRGDGGQAHREWTRRHSCVRDDAKRPCTPNFQVPTAEPGWWSLLAKSEADGLECQNFLSRLKAKVTHEHPAIRVSARNAWLRRWSSILACCASRSLTLSLLEHRGGLGADGPTPSSSEKVADCRHCARRFWRKPVSKHSCGQSKTGQACRIWSSTYESTLVWLTRPDKPSVSIQCERNDALRSHSDFLLEVENTVQLVFGLRFHFSYHFTRRLRCFVCCS